MEELLANVSKNKAKIEALIESSVSNNESLSSNKEQINARRQSILENGKSIEANKAKLAKILLTKFAAVLT